VSLLLEIFLKLFIFIICFEYSTFAKWFGVYTMTRIFSFNNPFHNSDNWDWWRNLIYAVLSFNLTKAWEFDLFVVTSIKQTVNKYMLLGFRDKKKTVLIYVWWLKYHLVNVWAVSLSLFPNWYFVQSVTYLSI
jgi:hypothetical protein